MLGAIAGDIIGSVHEHLGTKTKDFELFVESSRFTDDSVLSIAIGYALLSKRDYGDVLRTFGRRYPRVGYGAMFQTWLYDTDPEPYGSFGNGSAMRVAPVAWAFSDLETVKEEAKKSAAVTHDHPEGIRGAQAIAGAIFLARTGASKEEIQQFVQSEFAYDCAQSVDELRPGYDFDVTCQGTVPAAVRAFLDAEDFEDAVRNAVSLGGDADTLACITGAMAEPFYGGVPAEIRKEAFSRLDRLLRNVTRKCVKAFDVQLVAADEGWEDGDDDEPDPT